LLLTFYETVSGKISAIKKPPNLLSEIISQDLIGRVSCEKSPIISVLTSSNQEQLLKFHNDIKILDGNSHPVLLTVETKRGKICKQILKGDKDDLRQDSVMQQIFVLISKLRAKQTSFLQSEITK
jgi:hypothetical protein